jgi:hypothetical protein
LFEKLLRPNEALGLVVEDQTVSFDSQSGRGEHRALKLRQLAVRHEIGGDVSLVESSPAVRRDLRSVSDQLSR